MKKILIIHGPNLNLLGKREPDVYGKFSLEDINKKIKKLAKEKNVSVEVFQSNHEGEIVDIIGKSPKKYSAIVMNPAAYTHTSVAIRDAVAAIDIPVVEVHLSNIYHREEFRHKSLVAGVATGQISGFGTNSYLLGLLAAIEIVKK
ncbi:MAG: type II 3-dehydroquinate dehydratase [Elusimicrobia bacterium]|nr:type II 3-dehydroquinate dehydratase [Elusimicrobiota bacterium]